MTEATTQSRRSVTPAVDAYLDQLQAATLGVTDLLHPEVTFDATVPHWRYERRGADAVRRELGAWFHDPTTIDRLRRIPTPDGEVLDLTMSWEEDDDRWGAHQTQILTVVDGRITHLVASCGGRWNSALLAEMAAAAHAG